MNSSPRPRWLGGARSPITQRHLKAEFDEAMRDVVI
jgi:hypothetical protein